VALLLRSLLVVVSIHYITNFKKKDCFFNFCDTMILRVKEFVLIPKTIEENNL